MQLGTRWDAGAEPPTSLPAEVVSAVRALEAELGVAPGAAPAEATRPPRWTLTWLEREPVLELDTGHRILIHGGAVVTLAPDADPADAVDADEDDLV